MWDSPFIKIAFWKSKFLTMKVIRYSVYRNRDSYTIYNWRTVIFDISNLSLFRIVWIKTLIKFHIHSVWKNDWLTFHGTYLLIISIITKHLCGSVGHSLDILCVKHKVCFFRKTIRNVNFLKATVGWKNMSEISHFFPTNPRIQVNIARSKLR